MCSVWRWIWRLWWIRYWLVIKWRTYYDTGSSTLSTNKKGSKKWYALVQGHAFSERKLWVNYCRDPMCWVVSPAQTKMKLFLELIFPQNSVTVKKYIETSKETPKLSQELTWKACIVNWDGMSLFSWSLELFFCYSSRETWVKNTIICYCCGV